MYNGKLAACLNIVADYFGPSNIVVKVYKN